MSFISDFRRRGDRWWRYGVLKLAYQEAQQAPGQENHSLQAVFKRFRYARPSEELVAVWRLLVDAGAIRSPALSEGKVGEVGQAIAILSPQTHRPAVWLDLYRLGLGVGLFVPAQRFRQKAIEAMLVESEYPHASLAMLTAGSYAAIETGDFIRASELLERMKSKGVGQSRYQQGRWLVQLLGGMAPAGITELAIDDDEPDALFRKSVQGNRLALVGPVATKVRNGAEIDNHDLVVKFGYRGGDVGKDPGTQGLKLNVSYYNNKQAEQLSETSYNDVLADLHWAVFNNQKGRSFLPKRMPKVRQLESLQWLMPDTHLNAGPNAVLDLLRFGPSSLAIYNTDMMLSSGRFAGYKASDEKSIDYTRSFIKTHDPVVQFLVMHRLWSLGRIKGDERFESVMAMGLDQYLLRLQEAYGARTQALI
ncbi:hypothetical protein [Marinobacter sp.]|uniref:hypothetical protein n=1 Tax=Marinobacter sp. TaxID=50741 RepID=UPI002B265B09|nr:hypothetical protein [Marinobacter sp.]